MTRSLVQVILRCCRRRAANVPNRLAPRFVPEVVSLEHREVPAVFAVFAGGALAVFGDNSDNTITLSRTAAGNILVNGGAVRVLGGTPTVANTFNITVFGQGGNDTIALDEANGALPSAILFGGAGNDALTGGSAFNVLYGGAGNDTLLGQGGRGHPVRRDRERRPHRRRRRTTWRSARPGTMCWPGTPATAAT